MRWLVEIQNEDESWEEVQTHDFEEDATDQAYSYLQNDSTPARVIDCDTGRVVWGG